MKLSKFNIKKPTAPKQDEPKKKGGKGRKKKDEKEEKRGKI